jgi:anti-sigma regulatory factor (Ser/Thr protein kinase)
LRVERVREREDAADHVRASALDDVLKELLQQVADIIEVDTTVLLLLGSDGRTLATDRDGRLEHELAAGLRIPVRHSGGNGAFADITSADGLDPLLRAGGVESVLAVPLLLDETVVGLLVAGTFEPRPFTEAEARLLQLFADRAVLEVCDGGALGEHRRAWTLQRSVLSEPLPEIPGLALAARYLPARPSAGIGGGWYDVLPLRDGRVGLAVGDVSSRGEHAARLAGELRDAMRAYAVDGETPAQVASRMWHFLDALESGEMATLLYAVYDPAPGTVRIYSAAHPAPLFVGEDGSVRIAPVNPAAPLGAGGPPRDEETEATLAAGDTMLLYTEGLAERSGDRLAERRARIVREARRDVNDPNALCSRLIANLLGGRRPEDDVALLALQAVPAGSDTLHRVVPASAEQLAPLRRLLRRWLAAHGADEHETSAITLAVQEAAANAVEHAYGLDDASFDVDATSADKEISITVRDAGHWRPPRGENRGRGLDLMRALVDEVDVHPGADGTTVLLRRRLGVPRGRR